MLAFAVGAPSRFCGSGGRWRPSSSSTATTTARLAAKTSASPAAIASSSALQAAPSASGRSEARHHWQERSTAARIAHKLQALAPTLLLGAATALLYRAVVRHPASHITGRSATYMLLLAVQVALQPRISRWLVRPEDSKVSVALMEEVAKTVLALALWWLHHQQGPPGDRGGPAAASGSAGWSLPASLASAGAPAALYAVQGVLTYVGLQNLDAITFNGLSQLKTVSAAIFCYLILGTSQTRPQIAAIALLLASSLLFQLPKKKPELGSRSLAANPAGEEAVVISREILRDQSTSDPLECRARASTPAASAGTTAAAAAASFRGVSACLTATAISGLAGALSQSGVQQRGTAAQLVGGGRDPYLYCAEVSLYSALCLLFSSLLKRLLAPTPLNLTPTKISSRDASVARNTTAWATKFRWSLWIPVTVKAMGGIVTVLVHKHAGSVPKGFALVLGLVLSGMLERDPLTPPQLLGTIFVLTSSWMHFTNGPR